MNLHLLSAPPQPRYAVSSALKEIASQVQAPLTGELCSAATKVGAYTTLWLQLLQYEDYCTITINSAGGGTWDRLAEIWTSATLRVDRGHIWISVKA